MTNPWPPAAPAPAPAAWPPPAQQPAAPPVPAWPTQAPAAVAPPAATWPPTAAGGAGPSGPQVLGTSGELGAATLPGDGEKKEATGPRIRDYGIGRLVIIVPKLVERVPNNLSETPGAMQDRITADMAALDGAPIAWGGTPEKMTNPMKPHTKMFAVGELHTDAMISQQELVRILKGFLPPARPSVCIGRITLGTKGTKGNQPWLLDSTTVTPQEIALGEQWLARYRAGQLGGAPPA